MHSEKNVTKSGPSITNELTSGLHLQATSKKLMTMPVCHRVLSLQVFRLINSA